MYIFKVLHYGRATHGFAGNGSFFVVGPGIYEEASEIGEVGLTRHCQSITVRLLRVRLDRTIICLGRCRPWTVGISNAPQIKLQPC